MRLTRDTRVAKQIFPLQSLGGMSRSFAADPGAELQSVQPLTASGSPKGPTIVTL